MQSMNILALITINGHVYYHEIINYFSVTNSRKRNRPTFGNWTFLKCPKPEKGDFKFYGKVVCD
jgi:hypothetical protein